MARKDYIVGSGNVFEDLGHPRPAEALAKAELARKIAALIAKRGLTQAAAAELLKIDQPKVSALVRGRLAGFSLDRLVRFLVLLGSDVEIVVKPRTAGDGPRAGAGGLRSCPKFVYRFRTAFTTGRRSGSEVADCEWVRGAGSGGRDQPVANSVATNTQPITPTRCKSFCLRAFSCLTLASGVEPLPRDRFSLDA